eukprot:SAG31_NODE_500_length_14835_cov_22.409338_6_plen_169_part_00
MVKYRVCLGTVHSTKTKSGTLPCLSLRIFLGYNIRFFITFWASVYYIPMIFLGSCILCTRTLLVLSHVICTYSSSFFFSKGICTVRIRSTLWEPDISALVADMAPTIFFRLRQYVHWMYLGGLAKSQGKSTVDFRAATPSMCYVTVWGRACRCARSESQVRAIVATLG